ncbi:DoxX family protein [Nocardiopsis gilva YIM 90087]|uniref:DoxX family protein n=1 Tax=Nocardiopsis gilva YIM 90087 TaxID=1235441 RepID=A0A223S924_9ACTN|nr:DoxX family protein [Nocardiopsis gilva]ASU84572.1 DoxX family protein [Nocardiopsis gilva YIM 90087]
MPGQTLPTRALLADITTLLARIAIGAAFIIHGLQKLGMGVEGAGAAFGQMGVPMPQIAAIVAIVIELGGGIALLIGFALPVTGVLLALQMAAAIVIVHIPQGQPFVSAEGGPSFELPLVMGAASLALGFAGGGLAVDRFLPWGARTTQVRV